MLKARRRQESSRSCKFPFASAFSIVPQLVVRNVLLLIGRCELHAVSFTERTFRFKIERDTLQPARDPQGNLDYPSWSRFASRAATLQEQGGSQVSRLAGFLVAYYSVLQRVRGISHRRNAVFMDKVFSQLSFIIRQVCND